MTRSKRHKGVCRLCGTTTVLLPSGLCGGCWESERVKYRNESFMQSTTNGIEEEQAERLRLEEEGRRRAMAYAEGY